MNLITLKDIKSDFVVKDIGIEAKETVPIIQEYIDSMYIDKGKVRDMVMDWIRQCPGSHVEATQRCTCCVNDRCQACKKLMFIFNITEEMLVC